MQGPGLDGTAPLERESEDEQEAETTRMVQAAVGNVDSTAVKQEVAAWLRRMGRRCEAWLLQSKLCWLAVGIMLLVIIIIIIIIPIVLLELRTPSEHCPSEWIGYKKKCYFISEEEKNWTSSRTFCAKNESFLAVFENPEEMHSLAKRLRIDDSWIGLRKKGESFYWENGIALKLDMFQIWNRSECAYLNTFTILTSACSLPRRWICVHFPKEMT